jgi:phage baseplate assembly protein W
MSRADRITPKSIQSEYYSDFLMNLDRNPISGELARVNNERSVVRAMKNLILTRRGERFFDSTIGCGIDNYLFEPMDDVTADLIRTSIETTITQHEPRVELKLVDVQPREDMNAYVIAITYALVNAPAQFLSFSTVLKRVR